MAPDGMLAIKRTNEIVLRQPNLSAYLGINDPVMQDYRRIFNRMHETLQIPPDYALARGTRMRNASTM